MEEFILPELPEEKEQKAEVMALQEEQAELIAAVEKTETQIRDLRRREEAMRAQLLKAMEEHGVKSLDTGGLKITYIEPTTRKSLDTARLRAEMPEVAERFEKETQVGASVKITVRKEAS